MRMAKNLIVGLTQINEVVFKVVEWQASYRVPFYSTMTADLLSFILIQYHRC